MGPRTREAIRQFQIDAGLPATGALDSELLAILEAPGLRGGGITEPSAILRMETKLDGLGWAVGEIDGVVDRQLKIALTKYSRFAGIPFDHEPTLITLIHVDRHYLRNDSQLASKLVWDVETELARRGYRTGFIDGTDDPLTFDAILDYEGDAGLPLNGRVNPILLDSLEIVDSRPVTMRDIDEIERRLQRRGYAPGAIDGVADPETKSAIEMYQADAGHAPTGRPTLMLLDDLRGLNSQSSSYVSRSGVL